MIPKITQDAPNIKQYYGYTKAEAIRRYKEDSKTIFEVRGKAHG